MAIISSQSLRWRSLELFLRSKLIHAKSLSNCVTTRVALCKGRILDRPGAENVHSSDPDVNVVKTLVR